MLRRIIYQRAFSNDFKKTFSLAGIVSGNWSCMNNNDNRVLFFVNLGFRKYQALLNDKFLDVNITNSSAANIAWDSYNFSINFQNYSTNHYFGFAKISENLILNIEFQSRKACEVVLVDSYSRTINSWVYAKIQLPEATFLDFIKVFAFGFLIFYLSHKLVESIKRSSK